MSFEMSCYYLVMSSDNLRNNAQQVKFSSTFFQLLISILSDGCGYRKFSSTFNFLPKFSKFVYLPEFNFLPKLKEWFYIDSLGRGCLVIERAHFAAALPSGIAQKTVFGLGWIKMQGWCWSPRWIFNLSFLNFKKNVFKMKVFTGCTFMQRLASIWMVGSAPNVDLGLGMFRTECWAEWSRLLGWDSLWVCSQWLVFF